MLCYIYDVICAQELTIIVLLYRPDDAQVEITAKVFHGYNAGKAYQGIDENELKKTRGRDYDYEGKDKKKNVVVEEK